MREPIYTRWLSLHSAVETVFRIWHSLVLALEDQAEGISAADAAKAKGHLSQITTFQFVATTALLNGLLSVLSRLSKSFQAQSLDRSMIHPLVRSAKSSLSSINQEPGAHLADILNLVDERQLEGEREIKIRYKEVEVKVNESSYASFHRTKDRFIEEVISNIDYRFPADSKSVVDALGILNPRKCPATANLGNYGNEELQVLVDHYGMEKNGKDGPVPPIIDEAETKFEWVQSRQVIAANYRQLSLREMSKLLIVEHQDLYPNFAKLALVALIIPVTNADSERAFCTQNRQKNKLRNRLGHSTVDQLMRIEANGRPDMDGLVDGCVKQWQEARRGR